MFIGKAYYHHLKLGCYHTIPQLSLSIMIQTTEHPANKVEQPFWVNAQLTGFWFQRFVCVLFWSFVQNLWNWHTQLSSPVFYQSRKAASVIPFCLCTSVLQVCLSAELLDLFWCQHMICVALVWLDHQTVLHMSMSSRCTGRTWRLQPEHTWWNDTLKVKHV